MGYFEDGDSGLPIRTKINDLAQLFSLTTTDGAITAGTITLINIIPINSSVSSNVALSGQRIYIVDSDTGVITTFYLSTNWAKSHDQLSVVSKVLASDITATSFIFIPFHDVASYAFNS